MGADESFQHSGQRNGAVIALEFLLNGVRARFANTHAHSKQHVRVYVTGYFVHSYFLQVI